MAVTMEAIKKLRAMTGAGMLDVKNTLTETDGDIDKAVQLLRERGIAKADKKAGRDASEGIIGHYTHHNGKIATLVELNCETDFVAMNEQFQDLARNLAIHVAMADPAYVSRDDIPEADAAEEKARLLKEAENEGKPANVLEKIVEGRMEKWYAEQVMMDQQYIKDDKKTVGDLIKEGIATMGENIRIGRIARIAVGQ